MESAIKRVGVIGVGHLGQHHARVYTELLDARLVGIVDRDEERAHLIGENLGVPAYSTMEELIARLRALLRRSGASTEQEDNVLEG